MEIIERVQKIIDKEGLNVSSFAKRIGVVDQTVRGIVVQRRNKPGFDLIVKILQTFNWVNAEWLLLGVGDMVKATDGGKQDNVENCSMNELIHYLREKDIKIEKLIEEKTELKVLYELLKKESARARD